MPTGTNINQTKLAADETKVVAMVATGAAAMAVATATGTGMATTTGMATNRATVTVTAATTMAMLVKMVSMAMIVMMVMIVAAWKSPVVVAEVVVMGVGGGDGCGNSLGP